MNCEYAQRWMLMISNDLREAKRDLGGRTDADEVFLLARIAEDEAILNWLGRILHAGGAHDHAPDLGYGIGNPAQAF